MSIQTPGLDWARPLMVLRQLQADLEEAKIAAQSAAPVLEVAPRTRGNGAAGLEGESTTDIGSEPTSDVPGRGDSKKGFFAPRPGFGEER